MNDQPQKRRGPLLWLADCFRRRPVLAVGSSLLLLMLAAVSSIGTTMIVRQHAREQLQPAVMMQLDAVQHAQWELMIRKQEERQLSADQPADPQSDEPAAP